MVTVGRHPSFPEHIAEQAVRSARERSLFQEKMILPVSFLKSRRNGIQRKMRRSPRRRSRHTAICVSGGFVLWDIHGKHQLHRVRTTQPAAHTAPGGWCLRASMICNLVFRRLQSSGTQRLTVRSHRMQSPMAAKRKSGGSVRKDMSGGRWFTRALGQRNAAVRSVPDVSSSISK